MNSRRSSTDELEATALFADHDVEEPIELDIRTFCEPIVDGYLDYGTIKESVFW